MNDLPPTVTSPKRRRPTMGCFSRGVTAWLLGVFIYFAGVLDGFESFIFQPMIAALVSGISVGIVKLLGVILETSPLGRFWFSSYAWAIGLASSGLVILLFGSSLGMSHHDLDPETHRGFTTLGFEAVASGYFALLFAVANWPVRRSNIS